MFISIKLLKKYKWKNVLIFELSPFDGLLKFDISDNKKYTMISLAYDCGFSTKSTFNKHFKLNTGKTPTEFFNA